MSNDLMTISFALSYAAKHHAAQRRKGDDSPYINHPINVFKHLTASYVTDAPTLAAAILHDVVEDTDATYEEIKVCFGIPIADIVAEVTDNKSLPKVERKRLQVSRMAQKSRSAQLIKMADKLDNITDMRRSPPKDWSTARIEGYVAWALAVTRQSRRLNDFLWGGLEVIFKQFGLDVDMSEAELAERVEAYYLIC